MLTTVLNALHRAVAGELETALKKAESHRWDEELGADGLPLRKDGEGTGTTKIFRGDRNGKAPQPSDSRAKSRSGYRW